MIRFIWNTANPTLDHPNDEDLSLGTPKPKNKNAARMRYPQSMKLHYLPDESGDGQDLLGCNLIRA